MARRAAYIAIACERLECVAAAASEDEVVDLNALNTYGTLTDRLGYSPAVSGFRPIPSGDWV
jgi:hypothetical protein